MQRMGGGDLGLALASGLLLALHFALWITSLQYTTVASSVVLVTTTPLFVGLASHWMGEEKLAPRTLWGIALSVAGGAVIGWGDLGLSPRAALGDLLALMGAMAVAGHLLVGRRLRARLSLVPYVTSVYSLAAVALLAAALGTGQALTGYSPKTYAMFLLLALVPQLLGHSSLNWALRYVSATSVAIAVLGEPVGATLLAYFILGETPSAPEMAGGALVLVGIYVALRGKAGIGRA